MTTLSTRPAARVTDLVASRARSAAHVSALVVPVSAFLVFASAYATLGIRDQALGRTGSYDLGIFVQGLRGYAAGGWPISAIKGPGFNLLGDHFSPVMVLLAPFYAVFATPLVLVVAQAVLIAGSIVPLALYTQRHLGQGAAAAIAIAYGSSFGVASAVGFDFHEVAFGAPLLACSLVALAEERWRRSAAWAAPLVLVKEDLGITVAAIGLLIAWRGRRALGIGLAAFGLAATAIAMVVLIPAFNPQGAYAFGQQVGGGSSPFDALLARPDEKAMTLLLTIAVTAFAALRSPLVLVAVPTFAWRFVSTKDAYWGTDYHYDLLPMVVLFVAAAHGLTLASVSEGRRRSGRVPLAGMVLAAALVAPSYPLATLVEPAAWAPDPRAAVLARAQALVPDDASVAASGYVGPQLVSRTTVSYLWDPTALTIRPDWIVADMANPGQWVQAGPATEAVISRAEASGYRRVFDEQSVIVLERR